MLFNESFSPAEQRLVTVLSKAPIATYNLISLEVFGVECDATTKTRLSNLVKRLQGKGLIIEKVRGVGYRMNQHTKKHYDQKESPI